MTLESEALGTIFSNEVPDGTEFMIYDNQTGLLQISIPASQLNEFIGTQEINVELEDEGGKITEYSFNVEFSSLQNILGLDDF